jgi:DNA polymerase-1
MKTAAEFGQPECILVDFRNLTDSSFYAYGELSVPYEKDGQQLVFPTGAIFGFIKRVLDVKAEFAPDARVLVAQEGGRTFRHEMDALYKASRKAPHNDLISQFAPLTKLCRNFGWSVLSVPGYEADDILATWAHQLNQEGRRGLILSNDKDILTHITPTMGALRKNEATRRYNVVMTPEDVLAKHGVPPSLNSEYLAIIGDSNDEFKGLPGVGEKKAPALLNKYGSIQGIYANLNELPDGMRKKFEEGRASLEHSLKLASMVVDLPEALAVLRGPSPEIQMPEVKATLLKLRMNSLLEKMERGSASVPRGVPSGASVAARSESAQPELFR